MNTAFVVRESIKQEDTQLLSLTTHRTSQTLD